MSTKQYFPTPSIEPQTAVTEDPSGATEAVYVLLVNDDDNLARKFTGQWSYMQQDVSDENRPDGHMTLEFHYSHNLTWDRNLSKISNLQKYVLPAPAKFDWWRSMLPATANAPNGFKRRTYTVAAGKANSGDLITFQNSPRDL